MLEQLEDGTFVSPEQDKKTNKCEHCGIPCGNRFCSHECHSVASRVVERPSDSQLKEDIKLSWLNSIW